MSTEAKSTPSGGSEQGHSSPDTQSHEATADVPPIITYPEFLTLRPRRPPLLTAGRVVDTLCATGALMATIYGTSKHLVAPMIESLNEARHSLADTTLANLTKLNTKLEHTVSEIPISQQQISSAFDEVRDDQNPPSETSSDSDPTELFHVDVGTQTSPFISRPSSPTRDSVTSTGDTLAKLTKQEARLKDLHHHLSDIMQAGSGVGEADTVLADSIEALTSYLDDLIYNSPYYHGSNHAYGTLLATTGTRTAARNNATRDDVVAQVKAEIRGIKGVLLSARNFPAGAGRT